MTTKHIVPRKSYTGTVSSKRQITIPAEIYRALHLQPGDKVTLTLAEGKLHVSPAPVDFDALLREHQLPPDASRDAVQEVREMRGWTELDES